MYYVYLLKSKLNGQTYVGSTNDLKKRVKDHNKRLKYNGNAIRELKKQIGLTDGKSGAGFTLIELLVVLGVFSAVSAIVVAILLSTLGSSEKTSTLDFVRQNGDFAMSTMARNIREGKLVSSCGANMTSVSITKSGTTIRYVCENKRIASDSVNLTSTQVAVQSCSFSCTRVGASPPVITIKFTLAPARTTTFVESKASVDFETSVTLRNE